MRIIFWLNFAIGLFLLGLFSTSLFTDLAKAIVARPRPYYRNVCEASCTNLDGSITITDQELCVDEELRNARTSFPSFHAAVALYSAVFVSVNSIRVYNVHLQFLSFFLVCICAEPVW